MRTILLLLLLADFTTIVRATTKHSTLNTYHFSSDSLPTITCPPNAVLSTGPFTCTANHVYTVTADDELPGWTLTQTAGFPSGTDFPLGATLNEFIVTDIDGNSASCTFTLTVKDYTPPVAVCDAAVTVSIGVNDPLDCYGPAGANGQPAALDACNFGGIAWVKASAFDNGSYDNCGNILLTIRRLGPYSNAILGLNTVNGHLPCNDPFPDFPSEFERGISEQDSIKFYCGEAGTTQTVVLTIYQLDANGNIAPGPDGTPIYNQCFIEVAVTDKIKPLCTPPAQVAVSCENFDPSLVAYGKAQIFDNCCLDTSKVYLSQCGLTHSVDYALFDTICNRGTLTRIFQAFDCVGNSSQCTQRVMVNYTQDYYIKFPNDTLVSVCNSTHIYGRPTFFGADCELLAVTYEDEIFGIIHPDACYRIDRTWTVINWCTYNPMLPLTYVPNPMLVNTPYHNPLNVPGPIVSACGTAPPWAPTISKINPSDTVATNFCTFWNATANGYRYRQFVKIADTIEPIIVKCPVGPLTFIDSTNNDPNYWNNIFNPALPAQNLQEMPVELSVDATDACQQEYVSVQFLLFLDLDADGVMETVVNCYNPPPPGVVYYGNAFLPNYNGGTLTEIDKRPVPQNQKWQFTVQKTFLGDTVRAAVGWNTMQFPNTNILPQLPVGTHKIKWIVADGCGKESTCEYAFTIQPSTFECIPPTDMVVSCEQFDPSLLTYGAPTFDGICPVDTLVKSANYAQFDSICSRGTIIRVFNARDVCGNTSQCSQRVVVNYKQDYYIKFPSDMIVTTDCNGTGIYGEPTFFGEDCELLSVSYEDFSNPGIPDYCYKIERTWTVINWCTYNPLLNITNVPNPSPNPQTNNPANLPGPIVSACGTAPPWASTIVKIYPTDPSPTDYCTFWNANSNGYKYKQLIKIIDSAAPVFDHCPAAPSYIADNTQNDPEIWNNVFNPNLPAQDLDENLVDLDVTVTDACSGSNVNIEYLLFLDLDADGQQETVVNSTSLGLAGLGWNNVLYNNINTPNFLGGTPTTFDARPVPPGQKWGFSIEEFISGNEKTASLRWNTVLSPNTHLLPLLPNGRHKIKWFATDGCGNNSQCEQIFSIGDTTLVGTHSPDKEGFALYQNEPNPFGGSTTIRFQLPESTPATLSVFDANGRMLFQQTADYGQGMHTVTLEQDQLASRGILFYKLEAGAHVAWRKMVLLR
ncbi:MAG: HYR domain-containing protein [Phycisphaerae bacterium]|nr:HYR domain-containing protein [Saprospiraceae bacterium]